jgi:hypothetical protein
MDKMNNKTCEDFTNEMWLYMDSSMPEEQRAQWDNHLSNCSVCTALMSNSLETLSLYDNFPAEDIGNNAFNRIIKNAVNNPDPANEPDANMPLRNNRSLSDIFGFYKLAFGGTVLAAAIVFIFITFINNPDITEIETKIPPALLEWTDHKTNDRIDKIAGQILSLKTDDWDIYIVRKNRKEEWNTALRSIQKQINKMQKEAVSTSM